VETSKESFIREGYILVATTKGYYKDAYSEYDDDYSRNDAKSQKIGGNVRTKLPPDKHPDKYETLKRLEREKKAMQRKLMDEEFGKQKRQMKQKKREKTNWTKQYEYGMLDEDDYSDY